MCVSSYMSVQVLVCIFLWLVVDVLKTMGAKLMANHFHQETYFQRMQEALRKEYFLMALSKPRSENRASKHIRVASTTAGIMTGHAASVTAGMTPRHADALRKVNEREAAFDEANRNDSKPAPKGIMRNLKTGASGIAKVAPRMVKFRSNIQFLGEKVRNKCRQKLHELSFKLYEASNEATKHAKYLHCC